MVPRKNLFFVQAYFVVGVVVLFILLRSGASILLKHASYFLQIIGVLVFEQGGTLAMGWSCWSLLGFMGQGFWCFEEQVHT